MNWQVRGFGNFSGRGENDMILRNVNTGGVEVGLEVYDISNNQTTNAFIGTAGLDWQFSGVGSFSGIPGETDLLLRNNKTGGLEVYDISNNQLTGAAFIGTVGLDWQFTGIAPIHAAGASDFVLRNVNTGRLRGVRHRQQSTDRGCFVGLRRLGLAVRGFRRRSSDRIHGQLGLNLSARASDGGVWRRQRRR
jgi:hypothetical protein